MVCGEGDRCWSAKNLAAAMFVHLRALSLHGPGLGSKMRECGEEAKEEQQGKGGG